MTVNDFHTYFVSDLGIWVHNTACKPINLPSYKNIDIDMEHISSGHMTMVHVPNKVVEKPYFQAI
jgi:hypothetical protein